MAKLDLTPIKSGYNLQRINDNFKKIEDNINNHSIQRDSKNNTMNQDLDMDSNKIVNVFTDINDPNSLVTVGDMMGEVDRVDGRVDKLENRVGNNEKVFSKEISNVKGRVTVLEREIKNIEENSYYEYVGEYGKGVVLTKYNQIVRDSDGEFWRVSGKVKLPYTLTGSGVDEDGALVSVGDAILRQDLANPDKGAAMVSRGVVAVDSIADLLALPEGQRKEGLRYLVKGYYAGSDLGGGEFYWDVSRTDEYNGGTIFYGFVRSAVRLSLECFGLVGDGVQDNAEYISHLNDYLSINKVSISAGVGVFLTSVQFKPTAGFTGAGMDETVIQWKNSGVKVSGGVVEPSGAGVYSDFTADGGASPDPKEWNSENYDAFTGIGGVYLRAGNVVLRGVKGSNTVRAGIAGWGVKNVSMENCVTIRTRGNFGDGFFFYAGAKNITHRNCRAEDFTRIGFVFDGEDNNPSSGCVYSNCVAENGHNRSTYYGGSEYNSGFWAENCTQVSFESCYARNTGDRGFTIALGSGASATGVKAMVSFNSCMADYDPSLAGDTVTAGFSLSALGALERGTVILHACATRGVDQGFLIERNVDASLEGCTYVYDKGGRQSRAISVSTSAKVWADGFFEQWTNRPAELLSDSYDTASIGAFSGGITPALGIYIKNYSTHDGSPCIIKNKLGSRGNELELQVSHSKLSVIGTAHFSKVYFTNVEYIQQSVSGFIIVRRKWHVEASSLDFSSASLVLDWRDTLVSASFSDCLFTKSGSGRLLIYRSGNEATDQGPRFRFTGCTFRWNLSLDGHIVEQNAVQDIFNSLGQRHVYSGGCQFINTGGETEKEAIKINATYLNAAGVYVTGCWKSPTISKLTAPGFTLTGSTIENL